MKGEDHQKEKEKTEQDTEGDKEEESIFSMKECWEGRKKARKGERQMKIGGSEKVRQE
jgi:hypothetical protein